MAAEVRDLSGTTVTLDGTEAASTIYARNCTDCHFLLRGNDTHVNFVLDHIEGGSVVLDRTSAGCSLILVDSHNVDIEALTGSLIEIVACDNIHCHAAQLEQLRVLKSNATVVRCEHSTKVIEAANLREPAISYIKASEDPLRLQDAGQVGAQRFA
ncbi:uncharacterized protein MONBRDRAFT_38245 [Monosiga brevicollis MX1]|uniref:C-CAP/cofactor C-like domain-containing protein n=1 Tax=Monosiga brevicollis TaxID=81824 RepID=A9V6P7_MONBE|nr:uncharacterized protein MONBRDRAFT_38245 [Monosiga brevicollis MX1]EDQ86842.1 predicted protein [Monosiga brevicollis MX1]|eukprot:XP_001748387.1 hypothetical protein [Monosiga brevicollis MX1]